MIITVLNYILNLQQVIYCLQSEKKFYIYISKHKLLIREITLTGITTIIFLHKIMLKLCAFQ